MLSRHAPLLVKERFPAEAESFGFPRMTDRRELCFPATQEFVSDTIDPDVTSHNRSSDQDRNRSVIESLDCGSDTDQQKQASQISPDVTVIPTQTVSDNVGESSTTYMTSLNLGPLHHMPLSKQRPRLTLSAFRRPEESVRVADPDSSRMLFDSYKLGRGIGHGAMSTVRLAERIDDGLKVALKTVSKHEVLRTRRFGRRRRHMDEWEVLRLLKDNPNVVNVIDVYETDDEVQMVLEYCNGGELFHHIQRNHAKCTPYAQSEAQAAKITQQILSVLKDLHRRGIVHRDVKPENILLSNNGGSDVKMCDFGLARLLLDDCDSESCSSEDEGISPGRNRAYSRVGSDLYAAPEVCMGDGYDTAVDVYSLGVTIYVLMYGYPPMFDIQEDGEVGVIFHDNQWSQISDDAKNLIRQMLDSDPEQRITAEVALDSPWIKQHAASQHVHSFKGHFGSRRRPSHLFSPCKQRPQVDLEMVKARLYKNMECDRKRLKAGASGCHKKRRIHGRFDRMEDKESENEVHLSMADLYMGVASAAAAAANAAKGVVCDERKSKVNVLVDLSHDEYSDDDMASIMALSI